MLGLGTALVLLSFKFDEIAQEPYSKLSSTGQQNWELAGLITVFAGVVVFVAACLVLSLRLLPKSTMTFGAMLLLFFIAAFFFTLPYANPHGWTMLPLLLSILGSPYAMLIVVIGIQRWLKDRKQRKTNI
jgi:cell division protein FtsW (lipid II flippase)